MKRLYKSENKMICGVCAGVAEYFNADPTLVRLAWILFVLCGGAGILLYLIACLLIPEKPFEG